MTSILTNNSAMTALQTLKSINMNLNKTQSEISTGKTIASAKDNSAVWAISKVMESDVAGFSSIADSLALGSSTISVARKASETVTNLLTEMKKKIVACGNEWRQQDLSHADIWQLFVLDPSGIKIEINFTKSEEPRGSKGPDNRFKKYIAGKF